MTTRLFRLTIMVGIAMAVSALAAARPPNIVFILADDLGWRDLSCYGSAVHRTPHLDRLAGEGMRFTSGYAAAPICSASRSAILTGRSPARLQFEFVTKARPGRQSWETALQTPDYTLDLPLEERTVGEVLGEAGYATGFFGKWHVSRHRGRYLEWSDTHGPFQQGFAEGDQEFGSHPYSYAKPNPPLDRALRGGEFPDDELTARAIEFVRKPRDHPFFLYLSHYYVHTPVHTRVGWLYDQHRKTLSEERAAYATMVETLDHHVGQLLAALHNAGIADNTLVIFTSDNGGHPDYAANGPLRGSKWNLYEGGIRVPWIIRWPGTVPAGKVNDSPMSGVDLLPTLAAVAGKPVSSGVVLDGWNILPVWQGGSASEASRSLFWHFPYYHPEAGFEQALPRIGVDDFAVSQTRPQSAIRQGDWKLLHFYEDGRDELYNLADDLSEQHDVSVRMPDKARDLRRQLDDYLRGVEARLPVRK